VSGLNPVKGGFRDSCQLEGTQERNPHNFFSPNPSARDGVFLWRESAENRLLICSLEKKMERKMKSMVRVWRRAATDLGIRVEAPYELVDKSGRVCHFAAYVPDFGSSKGALALVVEPPAFDHDKVAAECAKHHGIWLSCLNAEAYAEYDHQTFIDMLDDWQYFGEEGARPGWYSGTPWTKREKQTTPLRRIPRRK
jgi:hypothetical protein